MHQLLKLPLMAPERTTNSNTRILIAVKILLTMADSLTPNARIPENKKQKKFSTVEKKTDSKDESHLQQT